MTAPEYALTPYSPDRERLQECYEFLVDETENPITTHDRQRMRLLQALLDIFEYCQGADADSPMMALFPDAT